MAWILILIGLALLVAGAELLVKGASHLANRLGLPPLAIGLTVVAFATSTPELMVALETTFSGRPDIAVGTAVGSNIFNVLFVLGLAALVAPIVVSSHLLRLDVPLMIFVSTLFYYRCQDRVISQLEGLLFFVGLAIYTGAMLYFGHREHVGRRAPSPPQKSAAPHAPLVRSLVFMGAGFILIALGSHWLVEGGVQVAQWMRVSDMIIALTLVAVGTSLPELVMSVVASARGERDIAVGGLVGSNIFNLLGVLGLTALLTPGGLPVAPVLIAFDIPVMVAVAIVCLPIFFTGGEIARWEGALLLVYYLIYAIYLVLAASKNDDLEAFGEIVMWFVIRPTVLSLLICVLLAYRRKWVAARSVQSAV